MTTNMHELGHLMGFGHSNEDNTIRQDISGALGYSVGQVGVPTTASMDRSTHCRAGRGRGGQHVIDRIRGSAGCLVDMKVDELLNDDMTLLEISTGNLNALFCTTGKSFDGTREKADQVTVVQQSATRDIESEMLGGLDAEIVSPFLLYCCQGVRS
jgi:hypothetical protein